jgi:hypothetical protein
MGESDAVKGLVLASVFMNCYRGKRYLTVLELLGADQMLSSHYGRRSQVLSNTLRRYYGQGLLDRMKESAKGFPYCYNLTRKVFWRLEWMLIHPGSYLYRGRNLVAPLAQDITNVIREMKEDLILQNIERIRKKMKANHGDHIYVRKGR